MLSRRPSYPSTHNNATTTSHTHGLLLPSVFAISGAVLVLQLHALQWLAMRYIGTDNQRGQRGTLPSLQHSRKNAPHCSCCCTVSCSLLHPFFCDSSSLRFFSSCCRPSHGGCKSPQSGPTRVQFHLCVHMFSMTLGDLIFELSSI